MNISVLITVHNGFNLLRKNLLSLSHQSVKPDEVVISDDGSDEHIRQLVQPLAAQAPFKIKYVRQEHKGFRAARVRNNSARLSTGNFLIFLDQDIIGTRGFIEVFSAAAKPGEFRVAYPIRLSAEQSEQTTDDVLKSCDYTDIITQKQLRKVEKQFRKERLYSRLHMLYLRKFGPKLRSGVFSLFRDDYFRVNGFDENYRGWGNEDDDLGRRLHSAGIRGVNPFLREYPLHLYHEPHQRGNERPNRKYYEKRLQEIHRGDFRCRWGVENLSDEKLEIAELN